MTDRNAYEQKRLAQLRQLDAEIDKLKAKAAEAAADVKIGFQESLDEAVSHRATLGSRLDELSAAGEDAWNDLKKGVDAAWERFETALEKASSRLEGTDQN